MPVDMLTRVGNLADGGKFMVNPGNLYKDGNCLVYSVGSEGDYSFEAALSQMTNKSCDIHTFDPTMNEQLNEQMIQIGEQIRMSFHKNGFAQVRDFSGIYDNLEGFMQRFGHMEKTLSILKVDCEYCEYQFFPSVFQAIKNKRIEVGIIAVELHDMDGQHLDHIRKFFEDADSAEMRLYARDPNVPYCNGYNCGEYA